MVQAFAPIMNAEGSVLSLTYIASEKVIPGYGGGMSSAKAQLESDTRTLAWEVGRKACLGGWRKARRAPPRLSGLGGMACG